MYLRNKSTNRSVRLKTINANYDSNTDTNEIEAFYPGGNSGAYTMIVEHEDYGEISDTQEDIKIGPAITEVILLEGSLVGGSLITIIGENLDDGVTVYLNHQKCKY